MLFLGNQDLMLALPEIKLAVMALLLLLIGVITKKEHYRLIVGLAIVALLVVAGLLLCCNDAGTAFGGLFIKDKFASYMKLLVVLGSAVSLLMATGYAEREKINRIEYPILVLFATLGMMLMISANSLISLYMGLELQSLPLYVLAAVQRDSVRSTEAGLKYFVLGALSSGLLLYGSSLIYGFTGSTVFPQIAEALHGNAASAGAIVGMVMILSGLFFKISAVPFHMWAPDVYEGAPTPVTAFFAIAPKVAAIALLIRVLAGPFGDMAEQWRQVIVVVSVASMALGGVAAIVQTNIKRLLAYSSIGHMGYALVGLAAASTAGVQAVIIYMTIYAVMSVGAFCVVLLMRRKGKMVENIGDLSGLGKDQPLLALAMSILMFSMAGIPPLAGFFGKLFIFQAAVAAGLYTLAVIGVLTSVVAAYYYIRIIKVMYFDEPKENALDVVHDRSLRLILLAVSAALVLFIVVPSPVLIGAETAARSLIK